MSLIEFRFVEEGSSAPLDDAVSVDGIVRGAALEMSHWPGNRTPRELKGDSSTEIALNWAASPDREKTVKGLKTVVNNHFDCDGLLSCWVALHPDQGLLMKEQLIAAAHCGDFNRFTTPLGVQVSYLIQDLLPDETRSPLGGELRRCETDADRNRILYK